MINLNINRIVRQKGIGKPYSFLRSLGFTHNIATRYTTATHKVMKLADIEKLCLALHCTPNDLLEWGQSPADPALPSNHPLQALHRTNPASDMTNLLLNASPEKLVEVQRLLLGEE